MSENNPSNIYNLPDDQIKMPEETVVNTSQKGRGLSTVYILVIVIVLLTAMLGGGVYWFWDLLFPAASVESVMIEPVPESPVANNPDETTQPEPDETTTIDSKLDTSDELGAIEADLVNTNVDELDPEMSELEDSFSN